MLVVSEVALALVLLVGGGLLLRSLEHLFAIDPGFESAHVLTMQVQESGRRRHSRSLSTTTLEPRNRSSIGWKPRPSAV
jgi:hypothetical protein